MRSGGEERHGHESRGELERDKHHEDQEMNDDREIQKRSESQSKEAQDQKTRRTRAEIINIKVTDGTIMKCSIEDVVWAWIEKDGQGKEREGAK